MIEEIVKHLEAYENKTGGLSFVKRDNPDYRAILAYGNNAIPTLLQSLDDCGWEVIILLSEITQAKPVSKEISGKYNLVIEAWKDWGKKNGYI